MLARFVPMTSAKIDLDNWQLYPHLVHPYISRDSVKDRLLYSIERKIFFLLLVGIDYEAFYGRSLNFPWQAPEVLTKDGAYTIQEERDVRNAMQLCSESFDL